MAESKPTRTEFEFTDKRLEALPFAEGKPYVVRDTRQPGLICEVTKANRLLKIYRRPAGDSTPVRITVAKFGELPMKAPGTKPDIRTRAAAILAKLSEGIDPREEQRQAKAARAAKEQGRRTDQATLRTVLADYLETQDLAPRTEANYRSVVDNYLADWLDAPLREITQKMVLAKHAEAVARSPTRANTAMRVLRAVVNFFNDINADEKGFEPLHNPVRILGRRKRWARETRRSGHLGPHQFKPWFEALEKLRAYSYNGHSGDLAADYFEFLLLNGLRLREAQSLTWADVDLKGHSFVVRSSYTKNHDPLALPLTDRSLAILEKRKALKSPRPFPIADPRHAAQNVAEWSGVPWTPHDLRRTFITIAESLDISAYTVKALVNHRTNRTESDVTAGYVVLSVERLREPMQRIADRMLQYVGATPDTVVNLTEQRSER